MTKHKRLSHLQNEYIYFKDQLIHEKKINKNDLKYFTIDFYVTFKNDYIKSLQEGRACYSDTLCTLFYNESSCQYCEFLEVFYSSQIAKNLVETEQHKKARAAVVEYYTNGSATLETLHCDLLKIFKNDRPAAADWLYNNDQIIKASLRY